MAKTLTDLEVLGLLSAPQISLDGVDLDTRISALESGGGGGSGITVENPATAYRYIRLLVYGPTTETVIGTMGVNLRSEPGGAHLPTTVGGVASASSEYSTSYSAAAAFDDNTGTRWLPQGSPVLPEWVMWDFGAGNEQIIREYEVGAYYNSTLSTNAARSFTDWVLQGSNDGVAWDDLHTVSGEVWTASPDMRVYRPTGPGLVLPDIWARDGDVLTYHPASDSWIAAPIPEPDLSDQFLSLGGGALTGSLEVSGDLHLIGVSPTIRFEDTTEAAAGKNWFIHVNSQTMYFLRDSTGSGSWNTPHPMTLDVNGNLAVAAAVTADYFDGVASQPFRGLAADSAAAPSFTWTGDLNTGIYRPGGDQMAFVTGGGIRLYIPLSEVQVRQKLSSNGNGSGASSIAAGGYWNPSSGIYNFVSTTYVTVQVYASGAWRGASTNTLFGTFASDGSTVRLYSASGSGTIYWNRFGG